jgi:hypothetical protein
VKAIDQRLQLTILDPGKVLRHSTPNALRAPNTSRDAQPCRPWCP